ncbi:Putative L,D-transpeptidase YciB [Candidatus Thermoflexus japonica]|uniref:L,D-transpeptidase YciB n=1 Tax=Candidatus Thermoflexus japonica TaxID=2035417 RepID=A0A2H5Y9Q0_9CHLR|nr:Putative L,D-transpeptidase YciB [Candidatus Thermoflexus japonica]
MRAPAPTYRSPEDALSGGSPRRIFPQGYVWVSVHGRVEAGGKVFYQINRDEYIEASYLAFGAPSSFHGMAFNTPPTRPFGWIVQATRPSEEPGRAPDPKAPTLPRYTPITVEEIRHIGDQRWYRVGPQQWVREQTVGLVFPTRPPAGIPPGAKWIEVNLYEQTLAAYEGDRLVYATLISSGRARTPTVTGLFRIQIKARTTLMDGDIFGYYYLEDVPWTMFFYQGYALHGAYWHDRFGTPQSRGCVNLAPIDARWLFEWAEPDGDGPFVRSTPDNPGTWVWVHR